MNLYSVFDRVTGLFGVPFAAVNDNAAARQVAANFEKHPYRADLDLYNVGDFDELTGVISRSFETKTGQPIFLCHVGEPVQGGDNNE